MILLNTNTARRILSSPERLTACALLLLFCAIMNSHAHANKLGIWPIDPSIDVGETSTRVMVKNIDPNTVTRIQASVVEWHQDGKADATQPQKDIVISPPQIEIKPGTEQLFRIIIRNPLPSADYERAYRVILAEVPSNTATPNSATAVRMTMKYSLPLTIRFQKHVAKSKEKTAAIESGVGYRIRKGATPSIAIINYSPWLQRLSNVKIINSNDDVISEVAGGLWGYALANAGREFTLTKEQAELLSNSNNRLIYTFDYQDYRIAQKP